MMPRQCFPLFFLFGFLICSCSGDQVRTLAAAYVEPAVSEIPRRRELSRAMRRQGEIIVAYSAHSDALRRLAGRFQDPRGRIAFRALPDSAVDRAVLEQNVVLALGSPASNWISRELNRQGPFRVTSEGIRLVGRRYAGASLMLSVPLRPSPFQPQLPIIWISGPSDGAIAAELERRLDQNWSPFGWSAQGYEVLSGGERQLLGFFRSSDWRPDPALQFDFSAGRDTILESAHYRFLARRDQVSEGELREIVQLCESAAEEIRRFTGREQPLARMDIHFYPSAEEKGLRLNNTDHAHIDFETGAVHMVYNDIYRSNHSGKENELLLRQLLDRPAIEALERGLAIRFTEGWQVRGFRYWASLLFQSGNLPTLAEMLDNERFQHTSPLVTGAAAASFVDFLIEEWGRATFLEQYPRWQPDAVEVAQLEAAWHDYLREKGRDFKGRSWSRDALPVLRGFNFAHEGYAIYNGYISRQAGQSLDRMASLGSNAASVIPYSYLRDPQSPAPFPISDRPGSENDESVIHALYAAKKLGMITILKPHVWLGGGSWPGDVEMRNEADWQAFFQHYYDWIRHYALLAEIQEVDVLVIGTEFARATLAREADWVRLIRKIRQLYSGKITYAANWGEEFENVGFWNELDFIGLDCYYPLGNREEVTYRELDANFKKVLEKVERVQRKYHKPVLFTEIGYRSIPAPWRQPHAHADGAGYHGEHQRMCYEVALRNLSDKDWFQGLLFWKWPSYLESRGRENTDYYPIDKPAEEVVRAWFGRLGE